jgi:hypothetical protein
MPTKLKYSANQTIRKRIDRQIEKALSAKGFSSTFITMVQQMKKYKVATPGEERSPKPIIPQKPLVGNGYTESTPFKIPNLRRGEPMLFKALREIENSLRANGIYYEFEDDAFQVYVDREDYEYCTCFNIWYCEEDDCFIVSDYDYTKDFFVAERGDFNDVLRYLFTKYHTYYFEHEGKKYSAKGQLCLRDESIHAEGEIPSFFRTHYRINTNRMPISEVSALPKEEIRNRMAAFDSGSYSLNYMFNKA